MESKSVALSANIWLGISTILLAVFSIVQDYHVSGFGGVSETDVGIILTGMAMIVNRLTDKYARPLHVSKRRKIDKALRNALESQE